MSTENQELPVGRRFDGKLWDFVECKVKKLPSGYYIRIDTFDPNSIKECQRNYGDIDVKGKVVMDLGANIGGFARMAVDAGAKQVIAVEPCPDNFAMLQLNSPNSLNLNAAVSEHNDPKCTFYYATSQRNSVSSSTAKRRNSSDVSVEVDSHNFSALLEQYRPQVLKIDIEGKEYDLLDTIDKIPDFVETVAIEFHKTSGRFKEYPARFFDPVLWEVTEHPIMMFKQKKVFDFTFRRKAA